MITEIEIKQCEAIETLNCCGTKEFDTIVSGILIKKDNGTERLVKSPFEIKVFPEFITVKSLWDSEKVAPDKIKFSEVVPSLFVDETELIDFLKTGGGCCCSAGNGNNTVNSVNIGYSPTGDVLVTVNGVVSNALPVPKWTKEIKNITTINTIPNFLQTPLWKSVTITHDTATLTEGIHYTISGTTITFNPIAYGKDINVGELVELHYQYI